MQRKRQIFHFVIVAVVVVLTVMGVLFGSKTVSTPEQTRESIEPLSNHALAEGESRLDTESVVDDELSEFATSLSMESDLLRSDASAIAAWIVSLPESEENTELWDRFLMKWASWDFEAASAWVRSMEHSAFQERALVKLSYLWEERDPLALLDFALELPEGADRLLVSISTRWAKHEPSQIAEWAATLPNGARKSKILSSVFAEWSNTDVASALEFLAACADAPEFDEARVSAVSALSLQEPELAGTIVSGLVGGRLRNRSTENLVFYWMKADPSSTARWIDESLSEGERDVAARAAVGAVIDTNPELSTVWANSIVHAQSRDQQLVRSLGSWMQKDPHAAKRWIKQSGIPARLVDQILK